jgi:hypothetical protein
MRRVTSDTTVFRWHRNYLSTNFTLPEYAREIGVAPSRLRREFKRLELPEKQFDLSTWKRGVGH